VYDSFVKGYALVNLSVGKTIKSFRLQGGVDNIFNYTEPMFIPNLPGRLAYLSVTYSWQAHSPPLSKKERGGSN
jgi:outer membrane receptor for ferrienterochelin and colicins